MKSRRDEIIWDLKRQEKTSDEEAARRRVETISEREALDRVPPGLYTVMLKAGDTSTQKSVSVRQEALEGVRHVDVRK